MRRVRTTPILLVRRWIFSFPSQNSPLPISPNPFRYSTQLRLKFRDPSDRFIKIVQLFSVGGGTVRSSKSVSSTIRNETRNYVSIRLDLTTIRKKLTIVSRFESK